jgi:hypothetical protein
MQIQLFSLFSENVLVGYLVYIQMKSLAVVYIFRFYTLKCVEISRDLEISKQ